MALFKSAEEKEAIKEEKTRKMLAGYNLDCLTDLKDIESVKRICLELAGSGYMEGAALLGGASEKDLLRQQMQYQRALIEQNFVIIRLLDKLSK